MKNNLYFIFVSGLVIHGCMCCQEPEYKVDLTSEANQCLTPEQMMHFSVDLAAYKNIMQAAMEARKSEAYKKSLEQFSLSFNNLLATYTQELASRLNNEEKAIISDLLTNIKDVANFIKAEMPRIIDTSIDQATKEQRTVELNTKILEYYQQLVLKVMPLGVAAQDHKASPEEVGKNLDEALSQMTSVIGSLLTLLKPAN